MDKFRDKYRIPSARLQNYDYGGKGAYFITICTAKREHYFGNVINGYMRLSEIGKIAETEWLKTFQLRPDMNLYCGEFVVMPNHFHAIIGIGENQFNMQRGLDGATDGTNGMDAMHCRDAMHCVSTPTPTIKCNQYKNQFGPQSKNLASIVRGFKIGTTKNARLINCNFAWQPRFHDHIIRNNQSYQKIADYINNNPANWIDDKFYIE